jgi:hypothetical protein
MENGFTEEGSLIVSPDKEGVKRRQAEYLLLSHLLDVEVDAKKNLRYVIKKRVKRISDDEEPLIYFSTTTGSVEHQAREFNEVLDRCLRRGWVERTIDGKYGITDKGEKRVKDLKQRESYEINGNLE